MWIELLESAFCFDGFCPPPSCLLFAQLSQLRGRVDGAFGPDSDTCLYPPPFSFSTGCPSLTWPIMVWVQPAPVWPSACVFTLLCLPSVRLRAHLPSNACLCGRFTARTFLFGRRCVLLLWLWFQCFHLSGTTLKIHPPTHPRAETQRFTSGFITKILFYLLFFLIELIFLFKLFMFVFIWLTIPF